MMLMNMQPAKAAPGPPPLHVTHKPWGMGMAAHTHPAHAQSPTRHGTSVGAARAFPVGQPSGCKRQGSRGAEVAIEERVNTHPTPRKLAAPVPPLLIASAAAVLSHCGGSAVMYHDVPNVLSSTPVLTAQQFNERRVHRGQQDRPPPQSR